MAKFLLCFSLIQNTNRILSTKVPPGAITSINGMRVLSMWWVILGHCYAFQTTAGLPSKLFHIFITDKLPKFTLEEEIILVGSNCFNILKAKRTFCATLGLRSVSVGMRGGLFSSHWGGLATTFAGLAWCSSLLSSLDIASLVAHQRHSEPITLMEFCQ